MKLKTLLASVLFLLTGLGLISRANAQSSVSNTVGQQVSATPTAVPSGDDLFLEAPGANSPRQLTQPTIKRERLVNVQFDRIGALATGTTYTDTISGIRLQMMLNLFDDVRAPAVLDHVERNESGSFSWVGHLDGMPLSTVVLTVRDRIMHGLVVSPQGAYEIVPMAGSVHAVREINQAAYPGDEVDRVSRSPQQSAPTLNLPATDTGSVMDVLVAYTAVARGAAGGRAAMETLIDNAINTTNQSYANSGINQRVRLAGTVEVNYMETGVAATDDDNLRNGLAGLQIVRDLRNAYAADLAMMIVESLDACGRVYDVMGTVSSAFATDAYGVVARSCAVGNLSFAHEMGHLMGARHDWFADDMNNSPYTYNHGFVFTSTVATPWRTIMAYNDRCEPGNCTRVPLWSNSSMFSGTVRMGVPPSTSTNCTAGNASNPPCDADNRLTLNNTAYTVANFRPGNLVDVHVRTFCALVIGVCVEDGTSAFPFNTLTEGVYRAAPNTTVWIEPGNYPETLMLVNRNPRGLTISRSMTLKVNGTGTVVIGP